MPTASKKREASPATRKRFAAWQAVERVAARQHGVLATWQATDLGLCKDTLLRQLRAHGWEQLSRGIWAAPWSEESFERRCAVERARGGRARLITSGAALTLLGVRRSKATSIDLWVGPRVSPPARPGVRYHRGVWVTGERVTRVQGIPCVPPLRALRDASKTSSVDRLMRDIAGLDRLRRATPAEVLADLERVGRFPGKARLLVATLASLEGLVHSRDEEAARGLLVVAPYRLHPRPLLVEARGRRVGEIDLAVCAIRYGAEIDGPHHLEDGAAERDAWRDRALGRLAWRIDRFPADMVREDPRGFVEAVCAGMAEAAARRPEPWPCPVC